MTTGLSSKENAATPIVDVQNLSLSFDVSGGSGAASLKALDGVSFQVMAGESFGIVGESGSGKSTLLRVLSRLTPPDEGQISLCDKDLFSIKNNELSSILNLIFQNPYGAFNPVFRVRKILAEPLDVAGLNVSAKILASALESVGLNASLLDRYPHELSGGQRQRLSIARALLRKPRLLLLDEPTSALDVSVQAEILNLLTRLRRDEGLTYLFVSHDLSVVAHMCERVAVMREGRLVEILFNQELLTGNVATPYTKDLIAAASGSLRP